MSTRLLNLGPCTCSVVAPEPVHEAMRHYVSPFLVPTLDGEPDITVSISCDSAAVADARRSLADQPATALRTSHMAPPRGAGTQQQPPTATALVRRDLLARPSRGRTSHGRAGRAVAPQAERLGRALADHHRAALR